MAWLSGWSKRIPLTVDHTQIDGSGQANFPVRVHLSTSSGTTSVDVSCVFDELTSNANRKKIAFTTADEVTECYAEIELWDDANEEAELWVKLPAIVNGANTNFYLYYDAAHADNTAHVGDTTDAVTHNVWNNGFVGVWHMAQDPNGDATDVIKDSTSNANEGTPAGSMTSADLVDATIGKGIDFDGSDDRVVCGSDSSLDDVTQKTLEFIMTPDTFGGAGYGRLLDKDAWSTFLRTSDSTFLYSDKFIGNTGIWNLPTNSIVTGATHAIAVTFDRSSYLNNPRIYTSGLSRSVTEDQTPSGAAPSDAADDFRIGNHPINTRGFDGVLEEVRFSNVIRTASWIKASYYSNFDDLLIFGSEEEEEDATNLFDGKVKILLGATNLLDGSASVTSGGDAVNILDGKAQVGDAVASLLDGETRVQGAAAELLDGLAQIGGAATELFDGSAEVLLPGEGVAYLDGLTQVKDITTQLLDGSAIVMDATAGLFDGRVAVGARVVYSLLDGKALIEGLIQNSIHGEVPPPTGTFTASFAEYTSSMYVLDFALQPGGTTQYINYDFNSMIRMGNKFIGANSDGIYELDGGTDDGAPISAYFEPIYTDFGISNPKKIRFLYLGYEADGNLIASVSSRQGARSFTVDADTGGQQCDRITVSRDIKGRYITFGISNVDGADFGFDSMDALVIVLPRGMKGC